jgi:hypothetical protein
MAVDMVLDYNAEAFSVDDVDATGLATGFSIVHNPAGGKLRIGMAGTSTFSGSGKIINIVLAKDSQPAPSTHDDISITEAYFNDTAVRIEGNPVERKVTFGLGPVAPNPFADGTVVNFTMAASADVSLKIYNVNGQLVMTLMDGTMPAGQHSVKWDGRDMTGARVARGVYFCQMRTADTVAIEKLVLMK